MLGHPASLEPPAQRRPSHRARVVSLPRVGEAGQADFQVIGRHFLEGATVLLDGDRLETQRESEGELKASRDPAQRPAAGNRALIQVLNPSGDDPLSNAMRLDFQ